jgi:hypothetical protein
VNKQNLEKYGGKTTKYFSTDRERLHEERDLDKARAKTPYFVYEETIGGWDEIERELWKDGERRWQEGSLGVHAHAKMPSLNGRRSIFRDNGRKQRKIRKLGGEGSACTRDHHREAFVAQI